MSEFDFGFNYIAVLESSGSSFRFCTLAAFRFPKDAIGFALNFDFAVEHTSLTVKRVTGDSSNSFVPLVTVYPDRSYWDFRDDSLHCLG